MTNAISVNHNEMVSYDVVVRYDTLPLYYQVRCMLLMTAEKNHDVTMEKASPENLCMSWYILARCMILMTVEKNHGIVEKLGRPAPPLAVIDVTSRERYR